MRAQMRIEGGSADSRPAASTQSHGVACMALRAFDVAVNVAVRIGLPPQNSRMSGSDNLCIEASHLRPNTCEPAGIRTQDTRIKSPLL